MTDVLTIGEAMAALRAVEPLRLGGQLRLTTAGAEATVAIGLARLGHAARWAGVVGADEFGALILRTLRGEAVDVACARTDGEHPTGLIVFEPRIADIVRVSYYRKDSAGAQLCPDDVEAAFALGAPRVLHLTGITPALGERPRAAVLTAMRLARAAGCVICLDVNHRASLWSHAEAAEVLDELVPEVDVLAGSEDELALALAGRTGAADPAGLLAAGPREVVVKRGADGASVYTEAGAVHREARRVPVRDTMGAGDAFVAGYLSGLLDGLEPAARLDRAVIVGAFAVGAEGDWQGLPVRDELGLLDLTPGSAVR